MTQQGCPVGAVTDGKLNLTHTLPDNELWDENSSFWTITKDGQPFDFLPFRKVETQDSRLSQAPTTLDKTETSIKVRIDANTAISARIRYWPKYNDSFVTETNPQIPPLTVHVQSITGLADGTTYCYQVLTSDDGGATWYPISIPAEFTTNDTISTPVSGASMSFPNIAINAPSWTIFAEDDHYAAEYLYNNPSVPYWQIQTIGGVKHVVSVAAPDPSASAIILNAPSGGDDTAYIKGVIDGAASNAEIVGSGSGNYKIRNLVISKTVRIWNMPTEILSGAGFGIQVADNVTDVRIYNSPMDIKQVNTCQYGLQIRNGSHRTHYINGGFKNFRGDATGTNRSSIGIRRHRADDMYVATSYFEDIVTVTNSSSTNQGRAGAFLDNGFGGTENMQGGHIVNCTWNNIQSDGVDKGAGFYFRQSYASVSGEPIRIFACRGVHSGKRFCKFQNSNGKVYSCQSEWNDKDAPNGIGRRNFHSKVSVITNSHDVFVQNNRMIIRAGIEGYIDHPFDFGPNNNSSQTMDNVHYTNNHLTYESAHRSGTGYSSGIIHMRMAGGNYSTSRVTNCSFKDNVGVGGGELRYHYNLGEGNWPDPSPSANLDISGNDFSGISFTSGEIR